MSMSGLKHVSEAPRRFDVFTGAGRRRSFTRAEKAAIVEESYAGGDTVCGVARRHGLTPQQLFGWRRLARLQPSRSAEGVERAGILQAPSSEARMGAIPHGNDNQLSGTFSDEAIRSHRPKAVRRRARDREDDGGGRGRRASSSRRVASWCGSAAMPTPARSRR